MNASSLINKLQKLYLYVFHVEKTLEHNADQDQGNIEQVEQHDENPVLACTGAVAYSSSYYGLGNGPILLDNVQCTGNEISLFGCSYDPDTSDCTHFEDAGYRERLNCVWLHHDN